MAFVFLGLFGISAVVHLIFSWMDDPKGRAMTKPFPVFCLAIFYALGTDPVSPALLAALLTSWLGDVLLIPKGNRWFIIGGSSFLMSHFLFMAVYWPHIRFELVPWPAVFPVAVVYLVISLAVIRSVRDNTPKIMVIPMWLYLIANSAMNLLAMMLMFTLRQSGAAVAFAGAVLFFVSDCILFPVRYHRNKQIVFKRHFPVMLCYLSGELLITLGIRMIG